MDYVQSTPADLSVDQLVAALKKARSQSALINEEYPGAGLRAVVRDGRIVFQSPYAISREIRDKLRMWIRIFETACKYFPDIACNNLVQLACDRKKPFEACSHCAKMGIPIIALHDEMNQIVLVEKLKKLHFAARDMVSTCEHNFKATWLQSLYDPNRNHFSGYNSSIQSISSLSRSYI